MLRLSRLSESGYSIYTLRIAERDGTNVATGNRGEGPDPRVRFHLAHSIEHGILVGSFLWCS